MAAIGYRCLGIDRMKRFGKSLFSSVLLLAFCGPVMAGPVQLSSTCRNGDANWVLAIHGGVLMRAGQRRVEKRVSAVEEILIRGQAAIEGGARSVEVVAAVITEMEDHGIFNAGSGAIVNRAGEQELDASIMDGASQMAGAVASLRRIKNPILGAKYVMEHTRNVLFVGPAADQLLEQAGLELTMFHEHGESLPRHAGTPFNDAPHGTVGAVAMDLCGNLAAGTSTGGFGTKIPGRVGDSPIIGAGTYANETVAVSASGHGEYFIRYAVAYDIYARMAYGGRDLKAAATSAISELEANGGKGGVIAIDNAGRIATAYSTTGMVRGVVGAAHDLEVASY
jgi:isoaspartyl peptidase/L-asparaginase-like protein (Ntn-hydrolase superfamily)